MPAWDEITRTDKYQGLPPEARSVVKTEWFKANMAPMIEQKPSLKEMGEEKIYNWFMQQPDDTGQGQITSTIGSAARGFGEIIPGAIQGAGALTGIKPLETAGEAVRSGLRYIAPVNPLYEDTILNKGANVVGNIGSVLATAGVGGAIGKGLAAERIAAGATAAEQALATTSAVTRGANAALYGSAGLQGAASGAQLADQYGLEGGARYANVLAGSLGEMGTELLPFGTIAETGAVKKLLTGAPVAGRALGAPVSEAGEEGINQLWQNAALKALAPEGTETPGLTEGVLESAAYGGLGGGILAGVNVATGAYKQPDLKGAIDLTAAAESTGLSPLAAQQSATTIKAADEAKKANDLSSYQPPDPQVANDFEEQLRRTQEEGESADIQAAQMRAQEEAAQAQAAADRQAQFEGLSQNEPAITAPVGGAIPTVGQEETATIQPEQQLPDGLGVFEDAQLAANEPPSPEGLVSESETAPRITELARQAAAINAGQESGPNLGFPQVQPTVAEQPISPQGAAPTGIATQTSQPMSGDGGFALQESKSLPKGFNKLASSPTREGIQKSIAKFYAGENKRLTPTGVPNHYAVESENGKVLSTNVVETTKGFYFGALPKPVPPLEREIITPSEDKSLGQNDRGEPIYERADGSVYRIRNDRKDRPNGYPDFGGDLVPVENISPAPTQETPSSPAAKLEKEGVVPASSSETEVGGRSNTPVETKETPQGEVSSGKVEAGNAALDDIISKLPQVAQAKYTPDVREKAARFFESKNEADLKGLTTIQKTKVYEALYVADKEAADAQKAADKLYEKRLREEEKENARLEKERANQERLTESRRGAYDSIVGTPTGVEMNAVSEADGQEALAAVHNSGDVPGVLNAFVGTSGQFLANPENETNFPDLWKILSAGRVDEGNFAYGRAFVFTDGIGVNASDRRNAERLGVTPSVAAVRRVLIHEGLVHRGIYGLPANLQMQILQWVRQNASPQELDSLAIDYPQYADWATNPQQMLGLCEEFLAKKVEKITKFPKDGPLARLFDILRDIWRWVTGETGEPTVQNLRDVVKLLKAGVVAADAKLVNDGKIDIKESRPSFASPINAELARAAERFRQMNERQAVETPERLKELFNPNAQGSGTTNKLFEQQVTPQQIRSEIRAAYDRAIQGSGSVQAPIQQVFDEAKTQIPTLTERQFGEQLQALYEDGSAFFVPADRSDAMMAAGEKWGVYDASGMPASYVGVMGNEVKASRVSSDVINKQRTDYQQNKVTGESVQYEGKPLINSQGEVISQPWRTEQQYNPPAIMAQKFVKEVADSLDDITQLPNEVLNDEYLREIGAEYDGAFQTLLITNARKYLLDKSKQETDPEIKQRLDQAADSAMAFTRQGASQAGLDLNMIKQIQKDPRFAGMFALDMVKTAKKEDQSAVVDPNFSQAAAGAVEDLSDKSNTEASASIESDINAQKEESEIEAGEALLNPRQRTIWERMKDILRLRARIAKAKLLKVANIKASNAAESQADVARFVQMSDKELADLDAKLSKEFDSLSNEFFGREKPNKGVRKKISEEKPINPVIARMVSIVATKLGGGTNLKAALAALMPESPSYKDKIVNDIVSGIVGRVNQSIKKLQKAGALTALTKQLKTILAGNIKVEPAKETDESLGQKALKAFGYVTSNEDTVNRAWDEARAKIRETLREANLVETNESVEDKLNALIGAIPTQLYSTPQARSVIREALEDTKFDNSKTILENAAEAKAEVLSKLQEAVSKEGSVDPARWQRDQSYIIHAFDAMIADLQAAKDKVTQKTKEKLLKGGKMTELQRLLDKTREGWQWKEIFSMPKAGQIRRRADMLAKVKENEAFKNLTGAEQAQLVDLLDQAWTDRKATYLGQKLKASPIIRLPWITTQGAAKKLELATSDLLKAFNDGTYNKEAFNQILAQKYGVRPIDQAAMAKAEKLAEELQDPELPDPVYAKKADELLKLLANTQDLNTAKMLNDFWVTSVLAGPRTWFDIGFAALNGLQRILVDSTALALHGDFNTAGTALNRFIGIMPQAFKEAAHFIKTGDVSLLINSKDQFSRFLAKGLKGGQHTSTSYQLEHWDQDKVPGTPAWKKTQGAILRGVGRFMRIVERLLTALDHINATATKYGYLPISIAQNQKKYAQARLPNEKEMEQFRTQAKAYLLGGKEPSNHGEQVTLDAWTRHFTDKFYSEWQDVIDGASYAGAVASGVLDPEGIVGGIYNAILGGASRATTAADALKVKADAMVNDPNVMRVDAYTQKALATLGQLAAYSVRNLLGFRFIRFGAVKFADSLTYIPAIGLLRLAESDNKTATKRAMILNNQAFGIVLAAVGYAVIKAVADDDDPKKRGFDITGSLDGLTAAEKKQLSDSGQKEYTLTLYINGKPLRLVYKTWPISAALSAIGTLTDMVQFKRAKWDQKEFTDRMIAAVAVATTSTLDSASMSQFAELIGKGQYASDPDEAFVNKITRVGTNFAGGFIPRIFKDLDYWLLDPNARKYDTVWQNLGKEIPIARSHIGSPKLDIFSQPVQTSRSPWSRAIVQQPDDEAYNTLGLLNSRDIWLVPSNPELRTVGSKNNRRHLTDAEQVRYIQLVGAGYKQVIEKYGQKALQMPKERAKAFIADKTKDVRDAAETKAVRNKS